MHLKHILLATGVALMLALPALPQTPAPSASPAAGPTGPDPREARYLSHYQQITHDGEKNGEAYFSPDGQQIIFQSVRDGQPYYQIYVANADGTNIHRVSTGHGKTTCSFFRPDGRRIIYASTHLDEKTWAPPPPVAPGARYAWDFDPSFDIFSANPDGSDLVRLTDAPGYDAEDAFSPDGQKIVFCSQRDGDGEIYTMDADGQHQKRLTFMPGYDGGPFFSPSGREILWRHFDTTGQTAQVWLMNVDGTQQRPITSLVGMNWAPYFNADDQHIIFASNLERGNFELYLVDRYGNDLQRVTYNPSFDGLPVFSPDGRQLMWTSSRDGHTHIWRADFNPDALHHVLGISPAVLQHDVEFLASPALAGRGSGTPGNDQAAAYIARRFTDDGLQPAGDDHTFLQAFDVTTGVKLGTRNRAQVDQQVLHVGRDFNPLPFSSNGRVDGGLVFAGYGISVPGRRDDYRSLSVRGRVAVVLDGTPPGYHPGSPAEISLRFKAINARQNGAVGVLVVSGPKADPADDIAFESDVRAGDAGLPVARVKRAALGHVLPNLGTLEQTPRSFGLPGHVSLTVDLVREHHKTQNVVALLPGADDKLGPETVVVGAHFDHLGMGGIDSLAHDRRPQVHPGADDNASGTASLMALADALAPLQGKLRRSVLLVAFSGEEIGLLGSAAFVQTHPDLKCVAMVNMDMVGRLRHSHVAVSGMHTGDTLKAVVDRANHTARLDVADVGGGYGPSDHASFYLKGIPVLFFSTGVHRDYHRPSDTADKINYEGLRQVSELVFNTVVGLTGLEAAPHFVRDAGSVPAGPAEGRRAIRAALGLMPDYAAEGDGVAVADIADNSPAAHAGLQKGDRIVRFDTIPIHNIYDYTFALTQHNPGDVVALTVKRGSKMLHIKATLGKRQHE